MLVERAPVHPVSGTESPGGRRPVEPLGPDIRSIQPGGGWCMAIELAWGRVRRWWLKSFRPGYVARMAARRQGSENACPHEVLDPRDVKFFRNQGGYYWLPQDDPFAWRDRLPFVRAGLGELVLLGGGLLVLALVCAWVRWPWAVVPASLAAGVGYFYRNPRRVPPFGPGLVVAPADGRVVAVEEVEDEFLGGRGWRVVIFLSIFDVHVNRVPVEAKVIGCRYRRGRFLNALRSRASRENEQLEIRLEETVPPYRPFIVRQIAGAIARRIVCQAIPGEILPRGGQFGMIKLGSRTELLLPAEPGLELLAREGEKVRAGVTVVARYAAQLQGGVSAGKRGM